MKQQVTVTPPPKRQSHRPDPKPEEQLMLPVSKGYRAKRKDRTQQADRERLGPEVPGGGGGAEHVFWNNAGSADLADLA